MVAVLCLFVLCVDRGIYLKAKLQNQIKAESNKDSSQDVFNAYVNVYNEQADATRKETEYDKEGVPVSDDKSAQEDKTFTFTALGEIMMGGINTSYSLAFKDVAEMAGNSDYTFTSLTTNVVDLEKIEEPKSKYVVTKNILKAFTALGIDGVNVASDHMLDFGVNVFEGTKGILKEARLDVIGLQDDIIYAEHNGIKIAFIGVTNEIIGSYSEFIDAGVWVYDNYMVKIKEAIRKAQDTADTVVVITHLGSENKHEETSIMTWFYHELVNAGADLVLGNHALGVYPLEIYEGTPIIYSLGYLMHDTDYEMGKKAGIFKFTVNVDGKIQSLEFIPTYIEGDEVKLYAEYDYDSAVKFMKHVAGNGNMLYSTKLSKKGIIITFK